ncbi:MAG: DUF5714 domain-containing protein [Sulfurospirillaceae bacterium]|nr:DUF5714 domain-containing protein [Sulfurospirillaceae bacterium]MDD2826576.1 DUF5714 domain-containing protein [Sulfurospirillaceae bacterium]
MKSIQKSNESIKDWARLSYEGRSVYVYQKGADWFVPDTKADGLLQRGDTQSIAYRKLRARLPKPPAYVHAPHTPHLDEFWIHLTNRCNLTCSHCLFSSSPKEKDTLCLETIQKYLQEAYALGCRLFILSGGEPLVHPEILAVIETILAMKGTEVVILTNGLLLEKILTRKDFPKERLHFQISLDGLPKQHDSLRGNGSFDKLKHNLVWLTANGYLFSLSVCLHPTNIQTMDELVTLVESLGAKHLHLLWYFIRGRGGKEDYIEPKKLVKILIEAHEKAEKLGIVIDNIEALKTQIYAPKGTVHDGSSSGRNSLALGFDGKFYPSAALVGIDEVCMHGRSIEEALHCRIAQKIQSQSVLSLTHPLRFILGGGDLDHSYMHAKTFMGNDPYEIVLEQLALWLITSEAKKYALHAHEAHVKLEMGDVLYRCGAHEGVAHTHANCLIATGENASLRLVKSFYNEAALDTKEDILNPVCYEESYLQHIPPHLRFRGYGCGSPILEANLKEGEAMLDLGSGRGIECFIASKLVGRSGHVRGVDMLDSMLTLAHEGIEPIAQNLGYANLSFVKGYIEALPEKANAYDVVTSNCVLNLSNHKRNLFAEIFRVLKPGGRLVVSDVVCEDEPSAKIRNDAKLSGECIAGALSQTHLVGLLRESGFRDIRLLKRFVYRIIEGHPFYSLSFMAYKPKNDMPVAVIYRGNHDAFILEDTIIMQGEKGYLPQNIAEHYSDEFFIVDDKGNVTNQEEQTCACALPPELKTTPKVTFYLSPKKMHNCMVCQSALVYKTNEERAECYYCGITSSTSVTCESGHYVCDACHSKEALSVIEHLCENSYEKDMLKLFRQIREHPSIPKHGPEHHAMVPAIIVTAYRNSGGKLPKSALKTALSRGSSVIGGSCGFLGICGAASGVGIGFAILLESSPVASHARTTAQKVTHAVLGKIVEYEAARCCHREVWTALKIASKLSEKFLHVKLLAEVDVTCDQKKFNQYCYGKECPIF